MSENLHRSLWQDGSCNVVNSTQVRDDKMEETVPQRPTALAMLHATVPQEMKDARRWVLWRYILRSGKWTKPPFQVNGNHADTTKPETWDTFPAVLTAYTADGSFDGLGFALGDGWAGVDIDRDDDAAKLLLAKLPTYQERSPGGIGAHAIGKVTIKIALKGSKKHGIEQYSNGRYFTVTGHRVNDLGIADITTQVIDLHRQHNKPPVPKDYADIVSKVAAKQPELWAGDLTKYGGDHSCGDLSLVGCICFFTQDHDVIDAVFRQSGLYREKWDRADYRRRTIERVLSTKVKFADPAGERPKPAATDAKTGNVILSVTRTLPTAMAFMHEFYPDNSLVAHAGLLYGWQGSRYEVLEPDMIRNKLQRWLHDAVHAVGKAQELVPFPANAATIDAALSAVRSLRSVLSSDVSPPAWIDGGDGPDPRDTLFGRSEMMHMPTGTIHQCSPRMFNLNSLDANYDHNAPEPVKWIDFLHDLWGDDQESIDVLQQWFGYCLTADTSQQKAMLIIGPKRSGKGTVARVLRQLVGERNCSGPTISSLAGPFGLAPLVGKTLAVIGDARFHGDNTRIVTDRLLGIIGEDPITVDRKHLDSLEMRLPARFVFLTNEQPRFTDASGALPSRFIVLELFQSFYGRENLQLESELGAEIPGILRWAVDGWVALKERGRMCSPAATAGLVEELEELASPVLAFVKECCDIGPTEKCFTDAIYHAWSAWCKNQGRHPTFKDVFAKNIRAALPNLKPPKKKFSDLRRVYEGIDVSSDISKIIPGYVPYLDIP